MPIRYVIRPPSILSTPRRLVQSLGARRTLRWPGPSLRKPSLLKDFFLTYPPVEELEEYAQIQHHQPDWCAEYGDCERPDSGTIPQARLEIYRNTRAFSTASKPGQRGILQRHGIPVPTTASAVSEAMALWPEAIRRSIGECANEGYFTGGVRGSTEESRNNNFIIRPLRHSQGQGWRLTSNPTDFREGAEYVQEVYEKTSEYRVLAVFGRPLITLLKRVPEGTPANQPWNHAVGSTFITVYNPNLNRLRHTNIFELIESTPLFKGIGLAGVDIMYKSRSDYAVSEVNLCPSLSIPSNLEEVASYVASLY